MKPPLQAVVLERGFWVLKVNIERSRLAQLQRQKVFRYIFALI